MISGSKYIRPTFALRSVSLHSAHSFIHRSTATLHPLQNKRMGPLQLFQLALWLEVVSSNSLCKLHNTTIALEKSGCDECLYINTTVCSGYCYTWQLIGHNMRKIAQEVCTYTDVGYETVTLHGCDPGVDPTLYYPVALSCQCSQCQTDTTDCTERSLRPDYCSHPSQIKGPPLGVDLTNETVPAAGSDRV
ncbi:unnamed protein product [Lampetra fluviatilis]